MGTMNMTRRDVLAAFLGVPLSVQACRRDKRLPDGDLAFRPEELGHRIRDGALPSLGAERWTRVGTVIVGGGVAGLSAARRLLRAGYDDFVVIELEAVAGGTARAGANATSPHPWGAHYITAPMKDNRDLIGMLREVGVIEAISPEGEPTFCEQYLCREPQERLFHEGRWYEGLYLHTGESELDKAQYASFRARIGQYAALRDGKGRRAFALPVAECSDDASLTALDSLTMSEWLAKNAFTSERLRWLVDYACKDDFGSRTHQTSAWAAIHYFASRLAPPHDPQPVITWPQGNGWLVAKLMEAAGPHLRFGLVAADLNPVERDGKPGVDVIAVGAPPLAAGFHAERVIFAAPQFIARATVRPYRDAPPPHLSAFTYGSWMVANLTLSGRPRASPHGFGATMAWDNVLRDSPSLGYVVATHQTGRDHGPTVLTYYYPLTDDDVHAARKRLFAAGRDEWADVALADLERAHPDIRQVTTRIDIARWGHAMARPAPGMMFGGARQAAARPFRGIHFAHTDLSGIALFEEAFAQGTRAADEVLRGLGRAGAP